MLDHPCVKRVMGRTSKVMENVVQVLEHHTEHRAVYISMARCLSTDDIPTSACLDRIEYISCFYLADLVQQLDKLGDYQYAVIQDLESVYRLAIARNYTEAQSHMVQVLRCLRKHAQQNKLVAIVYDTEVIPEQQGPPRDFINSLFDEITCL